MEDIKSYMLVESAEFSSTDGWDGVFRYDWFGFNYYAGVNIHEAAGQYWFDTENHPIYMVAPFGFYYNGVPWDANIYIGVDYDTQQTLIFVRLSCYDRVLPGGVEEYCPNSVKLELPGILEGVYEIPFIGSFGYDEYDNRAGYVLVTPIDLDNLRAKFSEEPDAEIGEIISDTTQLYCKFGAK